MTENSEKGILFGMGALAVGIRIGVVVGVVWWALSIRKTLISIDTSLKQQKGTGTLGANANAFDPATAQNVAQQMHDSLPSFSLMPDNMPAVWAALAPITSAPLWGQVSGVYYQMFGTDFMDDCMDKLNNDDYLAVYNQLTSINGSPVS